MHYCLNHLVGGLKFLPCQMGPPGGQKGLIFGPILILLFCVGFLHLFETSRQKPVTSSLSGFSGTVIVQLNILLIVSAGAKILLY
mgnify:CR=1 FL=1